MVSKFFSYNGQLQTELSLIQILTAPVSCICTLGSCTVSTPKQALFGPGTHSCEYIEFPNTCRKNGKGGGLVSVVMAGIGHASFTDADILFGSIVNKLIPWVSSRENSTRRPLNTEFFLNNLIYSSCLIFKGLSQWAVSFQHDLFKVCSAELYLY